MSFKQWLIPCAILALAGCGSNTDEAPASASDEEAAVMAQADASGGGGEALKISSRTYTSGSAKTKISGFFEVDGSTELNKPASITDDGHTWIQYGVSGAPELNVLFTNAEDLAEHGLNIAAGPYTVTVTSTSGECRTNIDVQPATVSGHYSCSGSTGYNKDSGQMGKVDIEVDFNAGS